MLKDIAHLPNYPQEDAIEFGQRVGEALFEADLRKAMGGLGGCCPYKLTDFDIDLHMYIKEYLKGNNDSIAIIYAAMTTFIQNSLTK